MISVCGVPKFDASYSRLIRLRASSETEHPHHSVSVLPLELGLGLGEMQGFGPADVGRTKFPGLRTFHPRFIKPVHLEVEVDGTVFELKNRSGPSLLH